MHRKKKTARAAVGPRRFKDCEQVLLLGTVLVLIMAASIAQAVEYEPIHVGALEVIPDFNTTVTPTGSVLLPNGQEQSSELLLFKPRVRAFVGGERRQFSSTLEMQNGNYSAADDAAFVDWRLENIARFELDETRSLRFRTENFNTHEGAGNTLAPIDASDQVRFITSTFDASYEQSLWDQRGQLVLDAGTFEKSYFEAAQHPDFRDLQDSHVGGSFRFRVLPGADLQLQYRARDIDYADDLLSSNASATIDGRETFTYVGGSWEPAIDIAGKLRIASGYKETENRAGQALADTSAWETNVRWQPLVSSTLTFAADHTFREQLGLSSPGSTSSYRYNWEQRWASQLKTTLAGSYSRNVNGGTRQQDEGLGIKLRLDYAYSTWVNMFVAFGHDRRSAAGTLNFRQGTVMLGIAASFDRFFGQ